MEVRERLAIPESRLPEAMRRLAHYPGVEEGMILSTCNRVELLVDTPRTAAPTCEALCANYFQVEPARV